MDVTRIFARGLNRTIPAFVAFLILSIFSLATAQTWTGTDVGSVGVAGTDSYNSTTGVYTIQGSGTDIASNADAFHYVYQTLTADGELTARVNSIQNTNAWAKVGLMVRQSTAAGAITAFIAVTPGHGINFFQRPGLNLNMLTSVQTSTSTAPYWVKIVKDSTLITIYQSPDSVNWTYAAQTRLTSLTNPVEIGFAVCSHSNSVLCTATFDNITLTAQTTFAPSPPWYDQDIGSPGQPGQVHVEQNMWAVSGGGNGITGSSDSFHYAYQALSGDGVIISQVDALTASTASAGVMMRQDLTAGSAEAAVLLNATNGISFVTRATPGGTASSTAGAAFAIPYWVKLVRSGNVFYGYESTDGNTWTLVGNQTISMTGTIYVGLGATSGNNSTLALSILEGITPEITSSTTASGTTGTAFSYTITASNSPTSFSATGLPPGLTFSNGIISGTPTAAGTYTVSISATNLFGTVTETLTITVGNTPAPVITSSTTASGTTGTAFSYTITASNSPTSFSATGLPAGLSLSGSTISGTPTTAGTTQVQISASNSGGTSPVVTLTITVSAGSGNWIGTDIGAVGVAGTDSYSGGVYTIAGSGADIAGTADAFHFVYQSLPGDGQLIAQVSSIQNTNAWAKAGLMIRQSTAAGDITAFLAVTPGNGINFFQRTSSGGTMTTHVQTSTSTAPYWEKVVKAGTLITFYQSPDGVTWTQAAQTTLSSLVNPVDIGFEVCSHSNSVLCTAVFNNITLTGGGNPPAPVITSSTTASGTTGTAFSYTITASNSPTSFNAPSLPSWLSLSGSTISGTPTTAGTTQVQISASNSGGTSPVVTLTITVNPPAPVITSSTTASGTTGTAFSYTITASNSPTTYYASGVPSWLNFSGNVLSGTPTAAGTTQIQISASNSGGTSPVVTLTITVAAGSGNWIGTDIGAVGVAGTDSYSGGVYTIAGSGADIAGTADAFHFVYQSLPGDGQLVARVASIQNTNAWAKAGLMIRQTTAAGDITAFLAVTPGNGIDFFQRTSSGGTMTTHVQTSTSTAPYWEKVVKAGTLITFYQSPDGVTWTQAAQTTLSSLVNPVDIGFAVCSHSNTVLCTATFDNITLTGGGNPPAPVITSSTTASGTTGTAFSYTITASNSPTSFNAPSLPSWLSLSGSTISGTPTTAGTTQVQISASNSGGTSPVVTLTITVSNSTQLPVTSGLSAWYKADSITSAIGQPVSTWLDSSSNGHNATQTNSSNEPTLVTDTGTGAPAVQFNGSQYLFNTDTIQGVDNVTIFTVATGNGSGVVATVGGGYGANTSRGFGNLNGQAAFTAGLNSSGYLVDVTSGAAPNTTNLVASTLTYVSSTSNTNPSTATFFSNGTQNGMSQTLSTVAVVPGLIIGDAINYGNFYNWNANVSEIIVYNRVLSTTERQQVEGYLYNKYGIYSSSATWPLSYSQAVQTEIARDQLTQAQANAYVAFQAANPAMLTNGLKLWLSADSLNQATGSSVTNWTDKAGGFVLTQGTPANQPTFEKSDINGEPAIRFTTSQSLSSTASLTGINNDMTIITVAMTTLANPSGEDSIYLGSNGLRGLGYSYNQSNGTYGQYFEAGGYITTGIASPPPNTFVAEMATLAPLQTNSVNTYSYVTFYRNGIETSGPSVVGGLLTPGADLQAGHNWSGDIAEILVYDHQLTPTEIPQINLYLANKYGFYYPNAAWISNFPAAVQTRINQNQWNESQAKAYFANLATLNANNPEMLTQGLAVWLRADDNTKVTTSGTNVTQWTDEVSGNVLTPTSASNEPQYVASDLHSKPGIRFNGSNGFTAAVSNLLGLTLNADMTVITVGMTTAPANTQYSVELGNYTNSPGSNRITGYNGTLEYFGGYSEDNYGAAAPSASTFTIEAASLNSDLNAISFYQNGFNSLSTPTSNSFLNLNSGRGLSPRHTVH